MENQTYLNIWEQDMKANGWTERLYSTDHLNFDTAATILDVSSSGQITSWQINGPIRGQSFKDWVCISRHMLRAHGNDDITRLVVFRQSTRVWVQELTGVHYGIEPAFFRDIAHSETVGRNNGIWDDFDSCLPEFLLESSPQHLNLGLEWTAKIAHNDPMNEPGPANIVIVAGATRLMSASAITLLYKTASINYRAPNLKTVMRNYSSRRSLSSIDHAQVYVSALQQRTSSFCVAANDDPVMFLLPILDIHTTTCRGDLADLDQSIRDSMKRWHISSRLVETDWHKLRMLRHDGTMPFDCFLQYDSDHNNGQTQTLDEFVKLFRMLQCVITQAHRTGDLLRDYLETKASWSSVQDARAAMGQSKLALEEYKRTKLITVLAIFFVPISLSTSIFGMNINELTGQGQPLWVFVLTSIFILVSTLLGWGFMYQFQLYHSLPRLDSPQEASAFWSRPDPYRPPLSRKFRTHQLLRLIWHGHVIWAWKSGIAFSLLTSGRIGFVKSCSAHGKATAFVVEAIIDRDDSANEESGHRCDSEFRAIYSHVAEYIHDPKMDNVHCPCTYIMAHLSILGEPGFKCAKLELVK